MDSLTNKVRNKEANEQMHCRNTWSRKDLKLECQSKRPIPYTELKRILSNAAERYCKVLYLNRDEGMHE